MRYNLLTNMYLKGRVVGRYRVHNQNLYNIELPDKRIIKDVPETLISHLDLGPTLAQQESIHVLKSSRLNVPIDIDNRVPSSVQDNAKTTAFHGSYEPIPEFLTESHSSPE